MTAKFLLGPDNYWNGWHDVEVDQNRLTLPPKDLVQSGVIWLDSEIVFVCYRVNDGHQSHRAGRRAVLNCNLCVHHLWISATVAAAQWNLTRKHPANSKREKPGLKISRVDFCCVRQWLVYNTVCLCCFRLTLAASAFTLFTKTLGEQIMIIRTSNGTNLKISLRVQITQTDTSTPPTHLLIKWHSKLLMSDTWLWNARICLFRHNVEVNPLQNVFLWKSRCSFMDKAFLTGFTSKLPTAQRSHLKNKLQSFFFFSPSRFYQELTCLLNFKAAK